MRGGAPRIVVEGDPSESDALERRLETEGWRLSPGWEAPSGRFDARAGSVVCVGSVGSEVDAAAAVLAAARGAGVLAFVAPGSALTGRLFEDLRRIGPVQLGEDDAPEEPVLDREQVRLLELLSQGKTLTGAAAEMGYSRRTINRRLASAREALDVRTTSEALAAYSRRKPPA